MRDGKLVEGFYPIGRVVIKNSGNKFGMSYS